MKKSLLSLYAFITHSLKPQTLTLSNLRPNDFLKWRTHLKESGHELRYQITDLFLSPLPEEEKALWLSMVQEQLIIMSDEINRDLHRDRRVWDAHPSALEIRHNYQHTLSFLEEQLHYIASRFSPYYNRNLKITDSRIKNVLPELRSQVNNIRLILEKTEIDVMLIEIIIKGLNNLLNSNLNENSINYISHLYKKIESTDNLDTAAILNLLVKFNFNQPEFYLYKIELLDQQLIAINGLNEQQELLHQQAESLNRLAINPDYSLHPKQSTIKEHLCRYFAERKQTISELMEIRRAALHDKIETQQAFRILTNLTVPQLTLFFRVQLEVGLILKEHITEVYNFVAQHFYTEKAVFISSSNMLKLSTNIEFATVLKVYDMLNLMMGWLDEQFGVKNFKR